MWSHLIVFALGLLVGWLFFKRPAGVVWVLAWLGAQFAVLVSKLRAKLGW